MPTEDFSIASTNFGHRASHISSQFASVTHSFAISVLRFKLWELKDLQLQDSSQISWLTSFWEPFNMSMSGWSQPASAQLLRLAAIFASISITAFHNSLCSGLTPGNGSFSPSSLDGLASLNSIQLLHYSEPWWSASLLDTHWDPLAPLFVDRRLVLLMWQQQSTTIDRY